MTEPTTTTCDWCGGFGGVENEEKGRWLFETCLRCCGTGAGYANENEACKSCETPEGPITDDYCADCWKQAQGWARDVAAHVALMDVEPDWSALDLPYTADVTPARELPELPVIHLDGYYWNAGWRATPREEWRETLRRLTAADAWILDGNYRGTLAQRLPRADALVLLDPPTPLCVWRVLCRCFGAHRADALPDGCEERLDTRFLRYVAGYRYTHRPDALAACDAAQRDGKRVVHLKGGADPARVSVALGYVQDGPRATLAGH